MIRIDFTTIVWVKVDKHCSLQKAVIWKSKGKNLLGNHIMQIIINRRTYGFLIPLRGPEGWTNQFNLWHTSLQKLIINDPLPSHPDAAALSPHLIPCL